jgi:hypothetical protein
MLAFKSVNVYPEIGTHFLVGMPSEIHRYIFPTTNAP